jgi:hypothetical protein
MRIFLFFPVLFLLAFTAAAQESIPEMNDRATEAAAPVQSFQKPSGYTYTYYKISYRKDQSIYADRNTSLLQAQLLASKNKEIIRYVNKANRNRKREFIAFAALPLGILAAGCIRQNQAGNLWIRPVGITFLAASLSCIIVSPIAHHRKAVNYKKAIGIYNVRF